MVSEKSKKALAQLIRERASLQKEILEELKGLSQNPDTFLIENEISEAIGILEKNDLIGEDADRISSLLVNLSLLDIGDREITDRLTRRWDFLYPIEIEIKIDNLAAVEYIMSQNLSE